MQQSRCRSPRSRRVTRSKILSPVSGFTVTRTADGTTSVIHKQVDGDTTVIEGYRVYYGDEQEGEQVDSRCVIDSRSTKGVVTRQVRE